MNLLSTKLWANMSKGQRVVMIAAGLVAFTLGIIWFFYPEAELFQFHFDLPVIDIIWRPAPVWVFWLVMAVGLCATVLLLGVWWKRRKPN